MADWDVVETKPVAKGADPWAVVETKPNVSRETFKPDLSNTAGIRAEMKRYLSPENKLDRDKGMDIAAGFVNAPIAEAAGAVKAAGGLLKSLVRRDPWDHAIEAREAGYVLPPSAASETPSALSQLLTGWGGKIKTAQAASQANQETTNKLAAKALGLPESTTLTTKVFNDLRAKAGDAYQAVKNAYTSMTTDGTFTKDIHELTGSNSQAAAMFPDIMKNPEIEKLQAALLQADRVPTDAAIKVVKKLRFDANQNLKAIGDPGKHALGLAQRQAADAIDNQIERNLMDLGGHGKGPSGFGPGGEGYAENVVQKYRAARQLIAKSYDVEGATNEATGDVNARGLARLSDKGRPLSGELDTIANAAKAFPKAMQNPATFGGTENWSALDFFGAAGATVAGRPGVAGAILARPLARGAVLSGPYQNAMAGVPRKVPVVSSVPKANLATSFAAQPSTAASIGQSVNQSNDRQAP